MILRRFTRVVLLLAVAMTPTMGHCVTTVTVSENESDNADFPNLEAALSGILNGPSLPTASNPYEILVYPGIHEDTGNGGNGLTWLSWVSLRGMDRTTTILRPNWFTGAQPFFNMQGLLGIHISDITIDARILSGGGGDIDGSIFVCRADVTVDNVTYLQAESGGAPAAASFSCPDTNYGGLPCGPPGSITIRNSDLAPIYEQGGNWNISDSYIHATSNVGTQELYAIWHRGQCAGEVTITDSVLETVVPAGASATSNSVIRTSGTGSISLERTRVTQIRSAP